MKKEGGFTLIEILIVVALGVVMATVGFSGYSSFKESKDVEMTLSEVASAVKNTQRRSVTQEDGKRWGINFTSTSTRSDYYEIYSGSSYSEGTVVSFNNFRRSVEFSEPSNGRTVDLNFNPITGNLDNSKVISIAKPGGGKAVGDIVINSIGLVTKRMENNMAGYWHFDEGTGTSTIDATSSGNDGELINEPTWVSASNCKAGQCLEFDGSNDYIEMEDSSSLDAIFGSSNKTFTLSAWVYPTAWVNYSTIFNKATGANWSNTTVGIWSYSGGLRCVVGSNVGGNPAGSYVVTTNAPSLNNWHHIACVGDGENLSMYIDGGHVETEPIPGTVDPTSNNDPLTIGRRSDYIIESFPGKMDELRVYSTALSSSTIKAHYDDLK